MESTLSKVWTATVVENALKHCAHVKNGNSFANVTLQKKTIEALNKMATRFVLIITVEANRLQNDENEKQQKSKRKLMQPRHVLAGLEKAGFDKIAKSIQENKECAVNLLPEDRSRKKKRKLKSFNEHDSKILAEEQEELLAKARTIFGKRRSNDPAMSLNENKNVHN